MHIQITGRNIDVTQPLKTFVKEKFTRLERHFDHISHAHFTLHVEKKIHHTAKAMINVLGKELVAHCKAKDMYQAVDMLMDKLDRQVIRYKENMTNH